MKNFIIFIFLSLSCMDFNVNAYNPDHLAKTLALSEKQQRGEMGTPIERDLSEMDLSDAPLHGANLHEANLKKTNLSGAILSLADLRMAELQWANLSNADITGINFCGAKLNTKTVLTPDQIAFARLSGAICDPDKTDH